MVYSARNLIILPVAPDLVERAEYEMDAKKMVSGQDEDADPDEPVALTTAQGLPGENVLLRLYHVAGALLEILGKGQGAPEAPIGQARETGASSVGA